MNVFLFIVCIFKKHRFKRVGGRGNFLDYKCQRCGKEAMRYYDN